MERTVDEINELLVELREIAKDFTLTEYNVELTIPIVINSRLSRSLGRFRSFKNGNALDIQLSKQLLTYHPEEVVIDVLKHELTHYSLFELGLPHKDSNYTFINACKSRNICLTKTYKSKIVLIYGCEDGCQLKRSRRMQTSKWVCTKHNKEFSLIKKEVI